MLVKLAGVGKIGVQQRRQIEGITLAKAVVEHRVQVERADFGKYEAVGSQAAGQ